MSTQEQCVRFCFDGIKTLKQYNPATFVVFGSKTRPMRTLSFKTHANCEFGSLRGSVCSLPTSVDPLELFIESRVTKYSPSPTSADLLLVTLEQWFLLSALFRIRFPEAVRSCRCLSFVKSSVESSQAFTMTSFLMLIALIKPNTLRRKCKTDGVPI